MVRPRGYAAGGASTALKLPAPIQEVPVAVSVVPGALLADRDITRTDQALGTVSSVQAAVGTAPSYAFIVRGFADSSATLFDGFREDGGLSDVQSIERIEVLKGPASALYGGGISSGGLVNVISKRPAEGGFVRGDAGVGSFGHVRAALDANGAIGASLARVTLSADAGGDVRRDEATRALTVAPAWTWSPTGVDTVTVLTRYVDTRFRAGATQTPAIAAALGQKLSRSYLGPGLKASREEGARVALIYTHQFEGSLEYRLGASWSRTTERIGTDFLGRYTVAADGVTLARTVLAGPQSVEDLQLQNELSGTIPTGPVRHALLAGIDLARLASRARLGAASLPSINLSRPAIGGALGPFTPDQDQRFEAYDAGAYAQDYATYGRWHILGSVPIAPVTAGLIRHGPGGPGHGGAVLVE